MSPDNGHNGSGRATSRDGTESRQGLVPRSSPSFMSSAPGARVGQGDYAVVWNGQHCFGWVAPADVLRSLVQRKQAEDPPPAITIIEYRTTPPPQHADVLEERLSAIGERLDAVCERIEQVIVPLTEQNGALRNKELDMHVVRPHLELIIQRKSVPALHFHRCSAVFQHASEAHAG